jgi:hypothetical protein
MAIRPMDDSDSRLAQVPEPSGFDYSLALAKIGALAFPFLGTGISLFDLVTAPLRNKRFTDWCEQLRLRLNQLSQKVDGLTPQSLATNDAFISAFAQATQAVIRTHQKEKLDALRNAVLNVAVSKAPSEDLQLMFLNLVDTFTPMHLEILASIQSRNRATITHLRDRRDEADQAVCDLRDRGLINDTRPYTARMVCSISTGTSRTWGRSF